MIGIYKITNPIGEVYIGQSINIPSRWSGYRKSKAPKQPKLRNSFLLYGIENHIFEVICECNQCELNAIEIYYIDYYNCFIAGLNSKAERNIKPRIKSKEQKANEWHLYKQNQLEKYNNRDFEKEKRIKLLKYKRSLKLKYKSKSTNCTVSVQKVLAIKNVTN